MNKISLIGVSICAVVLLVLGSLSNVVGYQSVKSLENHAPDAPDIIGPEELKVGISYLFTFVTTDPDGDNVSYSIDWGDGTVENWFGPFNSNELITYSHGWDLRGKFTIKARAKDTYDNMGDWGTFEVTMPRTRAIYNFNWLSFLERFPILKELFSRWI